MRHWNRLREYDVRWFGADPGTERIEPKARKLKHHVPGPQTPEQAQASREDDLLWEEHLGRARS